MNGHLSVTAGVKQKNRICIVTPDVIGPIRNGGIGTHVFYLAQTLASIHDVTILFTGPIEHKDEAYWKKYYRKLNIDFIQLNEVRKPVPSNTEWFVRRSYVIFEYLRDKDFDFIHFQEWQGNGLHCIMAKRSTSYFQNTTLTVDMHSSTEWINDGSNRWGHWPVPDAMLSWCERYCCQFADILISPTQYMLDYCRSLGWTLAADSRIMRNCFDRSKVNRDIYEPKPGVLAFFGRLETRKGLEIFLQALETLSKDERKKIEKVYFLGKSGWLTGMSADAAPEISRIMQSLSVEFQILNDFDAEQAIDFICATKALAVIPSLVDNYPYTIVEALMNGIPVLASDAGGIPELLSADRLFRPNPRELAKKLRSVLSGELPMSLGAYDPDLAAKAWLALHEEPIRTGRHAEATEIVRTVRPLVSVCVPYYNYGQYLEPMVRSLQASTYDHFEVIIVNDGSTDPASVAKFEELKVASTDNRFHFLSKENGGIGAARNHAAQHATGEFLVFCDADNCSTPEMLERFLIAIHQTGGDVVSSHYKAFDEKVFWPDDKTKIEYVYLPIGAALEVGMLINVFGDANSIIRRSSFEAVGGFQIERHTSWEDWDIFARLCLSGHRLDVCPMELFWYRHTDAGFSRNTSLYQNHMRVLKAYAEYGPPYMGALVRNVLTPLHYGFDREHQHGNRLYRELHGKKALTKSVVNTIRKGVRQLFG